MTRGLLLSLAAVTLLIGPQIASAQNYASGKNGQNNNTAMAIYADPAASPFPVYGTVNIGNFPTHVPVQPVSITTLPPIGGSVNITNFPSTQPVSIATTVPVNCVSGCSSGSSAGGAVYPAASSSPFPVTGSFYQSVQPVSIATLPPVNVSNFPSFPATQNVSGAVNATVLNFPVYPTPLAVQPVNGTVNIGNLPATQPVSGAFFQETQPVSIASPVAVTGSFYPATQPVSIAAPVSVTGSFFQSTQPVSISSPVTVTGTFFQATQPVSGTFYQSTQPVSIATLPPIGGAVSITNFPTPVPLQSVAITSGLSAKYTNMAATGTYVIKNTPGVFLGISNLSTSVQITAVSCYDNATAASGTLLVNTALGLSPPWFPSGGIATNNGITCNVPVSLLGSGVAVYWR